MTLIPQVFEAFPSQHPWNSDLWEQRAKEVVYTRWYATFEYILGILGEKIHDLNLAFGEKFSLTPISDKTIWTQRVQCFEPTLLPGSKRAASFVESLSNQPRTYCRFLASLALCQFLSDFRRKYRPSFATCARMATVHPVAQTGFGDGTNELYDRYETCTWFTS